MSALYLHIPFCHRKCHYCDFHLSTLLKYKVPLLDAMHRELESSVKRYGQEVINTIYFGGGTPSVLSKNELEKFLELINRLYSIHSNAEITLEANPEDLSVKYLHELLEIGINRLSIGIQSFQNDILKSINRNHNSETALKSIKDAQNVGFNNITIDLIYAIDGMTDNSWMQDIKIAVKSGIQHLSCYGLTVENKTALNSFLITNKWKSVEDEVQINQYEILNSILHANGFERYEISNFAKPGFVSRHNSSYWNGENYFGIGPSAHSLIGNIRKWNISNNHQYIRAMNNNLSYYECAELNQTEIFNEYIITRMRTSRGISVNELRTKFGEKFHRHFLKQIERHMNSGYVIKNLDRYYLSMKGIHISNTIISDIFAE